MKNEGTFHNLKEQIDKIFRHYHGHSKRTRYRYLEAVLRFIRFLAEVFKLQLFADTNEEHIVAYVRSMQDRDLAASTIKNELTAIRAFYDASPGTNRLPDNQRIGELLGVPLERRSSNQVPRAWLDEEYQAALELAEQTGDDDIAIMLRFARTMGHRIHETVRTERYDLRKALEYGRILIHGKNGKLREVPLTGKSIPVVHAALDYAHQEKIFVPLGRKAHKVQKRVENWIYRHRSKFSMGDVDLTYHGLRHSFAAERYQFHLHRLNGDRRAARQAVAEELGHERDDVTNLYLTPRNDERTKN